MRAKILVLTAVLLLLFTGSAFAELVSEYSYDGLLFKDGTTDIMKIYDSTTGVLVYQDFKVNTDDFVVDIDSDISLKPTGGDVTVTLGDAAGARKLSVLDSGGNTVASINSDGAVSAVGVTSTGALTVGADGAGHAVTLYSDTAGDSAVWSDTDVKLTITGTDAQTALDVADGNVTIADDLTVHTDDFVVDADGDISLAPTGGDVAVTLGDDAGANKVSISDSGSNEVASIDSDGTVSAVGLTVTGTTNLGDVKVSSDYQPQTQHVAFDVIADTLNADDGTGIKIESLNLAFDALILRAYVNVTQGSGEVGDTVELLINDADDGTTATTTLVAAQSCENPVLLAYAPATGATLLGAVSAVDQYVVVLFKDVGDDGNAATALQGTLVVEYLKQ